MSVIGRKILMPVSVGLLVALSAGLSGCILDIVSDDSFTFTITIETNETAPFIIWIPWLVHRDSSPGGDVAWLDEDNIQFNSIMNTEYGLMANITVSGDVSIYHQEDDYDDTFPFFDAFDSEGDYYPLFILSMAGVTFHIEMTFYNSYGGSGEDCSLEGDAVNSSGWITVNGDHNVWEE